MDPITFAWTIAATFFAGGQLFFQKVVAQQGRNAALNGIFMYGISGVLATAILLLFYGIPKEWSVIAFFALTSGVVHAIGNFIRIEGLKYIDTILFFPINKLLGPLIALIGGAWFFADALTARQYVGIAFSLGVPLLLVSSAEQHRQKNLNKGLVFLVVSTVFTSGSMLLTKAGVLHDPSVLFFMSISQFAGMASSTTIFLREKHVRRSSTLGITREDVVLGLVAGMLGFISFFALLKAFSTGLVSLVYVIHAHYILIPIVLSVWWYGDHINARKIIAVALSFIAITLIV